MSETVERLFSTSGFMPHGHCYLWNPSLIGLHVVSDGLIALAYTSIPFTLLHFIRRRKDLPFHWMFLCFGAFIVACGATHVLEIWTLWTPAYWLSGSVKAITAAASVPTAVLLIRLVPQALAIPSPDDLRQANDALRAAQAQLEDRVRVRTNELRQKNEELEREISERKRAEQAYDKAEARFRRLADSGIIGIIISHIDGAIVDANDAFLEMVRYTRKELESREIRWTKLTPEEFRYLDERALEQLAKTGVAATWEKEYIRKDGTRVPILVGVAMLDDAEGESVAFVLDLTDKKRDVEAIKHLREERAADAKFRALLEAAPDAMVIVDERGQVVLVNAQAEALFGYSKAELLDRPVEELIPARFRDAHLAHRADYAGNPVARAIGAGLDLRGRRKDGSEVSVEIRLSPIWTPEGMLVSSAIRDVTERNRIDTALKNANRELEAFSYSVAHDLRAPLRAMSGFAQMLLDDHSSRLDEEGKDCLAEITTNAVKMGSLIDALLALARVARVELKTERIDLAALVRAAASRLTADDPARTVDVVAPSSAWVDLDANLARTLVDNLLENAWKFTRGVDGARVELGTTLNKGRAVFFVRDNGVGFDMTYASKLFAPFQRLHSTSEFPGTGVGLATVQRILHRHGGSIWAEGTVGRGATFYFTLPGAPGEIAGEIAS